MLDESPIEPELNDGLVEKYLVWDPISIWVYFRDKLLNSHSAKRNEA